MHGSIAKLDAYVTFQRIKRGLSFSGGACVLGGVIPQVPWPHKYIPTFVESFSVSFLTSQPGGSLSGCSIN